MVTLETIKRKLQALIGLANETTGNADTDLTTAVTTLAEGYGKGDRSAELIQQQATEYHNEEVTFAGYYSFFSFPNLKSVSLPNATQIKGHAFDSCSSLLTVYIPRVTEIGNQAFYYCAKIEAIVIEQADKVCTLGSSAFSGSSIASGKGYVYVPDSMVDAYKATTSWASFANQIRPLSEYTPA